MNRTERAIKKQYREAWAQQKKLKQNEIRKMKSATDSMLMPRKKMAAENVKIFRTKEEEARKQTIDYKNRANTPNKEDSRAA